MAIFTKIRPNWTKCTLGPICWIFLTAICTNKNTWTNLKNFRAPSHIDSQPFLVLLQPTLAVPSGQTIECKFIVPDTPSVYLVNGLPEIMSWKWQYTSDEKVPSLWLIKENLQDDTRRTFGFPLDTNTSFYEAKHYLVTLVWEGDETKAAWPYGLLCLKRWDTVGVWECCVPPWEGGWGERNQTHQDRPLCSSMAWPRGNSTFKVYLIKA